MWIYRLKDFFRSRLGHITLFVLASAGLFIFLASYFQKRQQAKEQVANTLPKLSQHALWSAPETQEQNTDVEFTFSKVRENFRPFQPRTSKPAPEKLKPVSVAAAEIPSHVGAVFPLPPMILSEHNIEPSHENGPILLPKAEPEPPSLKVEEGTLLYCQLTTPISSDQSNAPVLAQLTRPLIQQGQLLLPAGTHLSGSLERTHENRIFLSPDWRVKLPTGAWVPIRAHAQEAAYNAQTKQYAASDGQAGLPSLVEPTPIRKNTGWTDALGKLTIAAGRLGQDRARTAIGDYVPGTARNSILQGTSGVIEHYTTLPKAQEVRPQTIHRVEAGQQFYLALAAKRH